MSLGTTASLLHTLKYNKIILFLATIILPLIGLVICPAKTRGQSDTNMADDPLGASPTSVLSNIRNQANIPKNTIDTALESNSDNSLTNVSQQFQSGLTGYIDRFIGLCLILAVILIIINGFLMVVQSGNESIAATTRKRMFSLILGVFVLFSVSAIIRIIVWIVSAINT